MIRVLKEHPTDTVEMRNVYCNTLMELAEKDPKIVAVNCDLRSSMGLKAFAKKYPEREFNIGIAEQNGAGVAAGLSVVGLKPFFNTFSVFASRRVFDQIFMSCAYAGQNVKVIGGDAGISAALNGGTHMPFEDMAMMRVIPTLTVMEPTDAVMLQSLIRWMADYNGVVYMRMPRRFTTKIYEEGSEFTPGKGVVIRDGKDVTIITNGITVAEAIKAADELAKEGIDAAVIDMFCIKPLDEALVAEYAEKTGAIVTVENCQKIGALRGAVAEFTSENCPVIMDHVAVEDEFGEVGKTDYLIERFKLTSPHIVEAVKRVLKKKK